MNIGNNGNYLFPVHQLSKTFKGKFLDSLKRKLRKLKANILFEDLVQKAYNRKWVVHSEPSLASAENVIHYLGQYTHRVAITNQRILEITDTHVTFIAKDYRDRAQKKPVSMEGVEFLRRFCMHIMPKRFVRIRRFGIYNPTTKRNMDLKFVPEPKPDIEQLTGKAENETSAERILRLTGFDIGLCPSCKKGRMIVICEIPRIRSPDGHLPSMLNALLK